VGASLLLVFVFFTPPSLPSTSPPLKLATWNLEWLIAPAVFKPLKETCAPRDVHMSGTERRLPCDVAYNLERSTRDFKALARYARELDADVVALQEVDGPAAARLVFAGYEFCFTSRPHLQNNGLAIRAGLRHRCGSDLIALSLGDSLRRGAELILFPDEPRELHLLSIHLKSGCSTDLLDGPTKACAELARQLPALEAWIDARAREGKRFAVLGDFNRDLLHDFGPPRAPNGQRLRVWPELDDADPPESDLVNAAEGAPFRNCVPGQGYHGYIDFIVLSRSLGTARVPGSFERLTFSPLDARRTKLSDHCPVAVRVRRD
jgi:endonuclease/exonuclease/phosphatase family metal-dependent hydrolase